MPAGKRIDQLAAAAALDGTEYVPIWQGGPSALRTTLGAVAALAGGGGGNARRHEWTGTYDYCGTAAVGAAESASVWTITRIAINSNGSVTTGVATGVKWTDRATATYS